MFKTKHPLCEHDHGHDYTASSGTPDSKNKHIRSKRIPISGFWYGLIIGITIGAGLAAVLSNI